ncbi:hypothetical protein SNOG_07680 [Parastagonospora nodorum SN15]|uniref:Rab proteins geranylgeranyltransferase n=1 Tax=Phaeosphaeria nodorum (strain SN15 / ATCC MYA-4574 / FGSC 10173) TaxID=321614 RepID=Q0UKN4_PHANO|nr:hypothetical protein SNOG_07680 [Parastagonospora nodorum SN15]EAT85146.1 hypothetical protein SNOG_07680 [Parastagonospora nodorum SN15]
MDTLDNTEWDVLIVGTGLQQSLLALALSRSDKKILHIDENDYYGGAEAAFSLQEAEEWAQRVNTGAATAAFSSHHGSTDSLSFLPSAVGRVYASDTGDDTLESESTHRAGKLLKVPNGREDVFQDHDLDFKAKRALMKFLRFIGEYEEQVEVWEEHRQQPFSTFLSQQFKVPTSLQGPLMALTLSPSPPDQTTTEYALPRIARHLRSIGVFGAGFGAVIPKWGGLAEISQVSCRACAVGGGVYVLGKGLDSSNTDPTETTEHGIKLRLKDGEVVTAKWIVGGNTSATPEEALCRSISIVFSSLAPLFPPLAEDAPAPASAVVAFPSGSISLESPAGNPPPVQILVHSSDTGECPSGQWRIICIYGRYVVSLGFQLLSRAVDTLLASVDVSPAPSLLWSTQYQQRPTSGTEVLPTGNDDRVLRFPPPSADLAFDDNIFDHVKDVWEKIMGGEGGDFLVFQDREVYDDED